MMLLESDLLGQVLSVSVPGGKRVRRDLCPGGRIEEATMSSAPHGNASPAVPAVARYARFSSDLQRNASITDQNRRCAAEIQRQVQEWKFDSSSGCQIFLMEDQKVAVLQDLMRRPL